MRTFLMGGLLLLGWLGASGGPAQATGPLPITRFLVLPDTSGSLDVREYQATLRAVPMLARRLSASLSFREFAVVPWAGTADIQRSPAWSVVLPERTLLPAQTLHLGESGRLFRRCQELQLDAAEQRRRQEQEVLDRRYGEQLDPCLTRFGQILEQCRQGRASSTDVGGILRRCSEEAPTTLALVITDGLQEGVAWPAQPLPPGARTLVVLVPGREETDGSDPAVRITALRRVAPWALIVPSFRLSDPAFDPEALLDGGATGSAPGVHPVAWSGSTGGS